MQAELYIEAIRAARRLAPVSVAVLRSIGKTPFTDVELIRGSEVEIPRWAAEVLEKMGYVEVKREVGSSSDVNRIRFAEEDHARRGGLSISKIPGDFYIEVGRIIRELSEKIKKGGSPSDIVELDRITRALDRIVSIRLQKILMASILHSERSGDFEKNLSFEEKTLYRIIDSDVKHWLRTVLGESYGSVS
ncbi:MAG: hypothetical protein QXI22_02465 [Sulfolobales archaeon]